MNVFEQILNITNESSMSVLKESSEFRIFQKRINKYLHELAPNTVEGIKYIQSNSQQILSDISNLIQQESGHTLDLPTLRHIISQYILSVEEQIQENRKKIEENQIEIINEYLNQNTSCTEQNFRYIQENLDKILFEIVSIVRKETGEEIQLLKLRNIVNVRLTALKQQLEKEELERIAKHLRQMLSTYIDENISISIESIAYLKTNPVAELATVIYTKSGYQIDPSVVNKLIEQRLAFIEQRMNEIIAIQETLVKEYLQVDIPVNDISVHKLENNIEDTVWELARKIYEETGYKIDLDMVQKLANNRIICVKKELKKQTSYSTVVNIISERLEVDISSIYSDSCIIENLQADNTDIVEIIMEIEESFDIEITDDEAERLTLFAGGEGWFSFPGHCTVQKLVDFINTKIQSAEIN